MGTCVIKRILQVNEAINYSVIMVKDGSGNDITNNCLYSWSSDGVCWTNWVPYNTYNDIVKYIESDFYLRILISGSFEYLFINGLNTTCYSLSLFTENSFVQDFCAEPNLFQPYQNLDCAIELQQQMADTIACMFGIPIYYIKVDPESSSADYTFKEYSLHNVVAIKQIKLIIPDGEMPSSNPKLSDLDFDWETDWDVELSKTQFATAFGDKAFPKNRDIIYIPMMKRLWTVNSAYDEKRDGIMWHSTTWKLSLIKYNENTNIDLGSFDEAITQWTNNQEYSKQLAPLENNEQKRLTGAQPLSSPKYAANNLYNIFTEDAVRKQYTKHDLLIVNKNYCQKNIVLARNLYKFKNENGCIVYQEGICGDNGTIMFIMDLVGTLNGPIERCILEFGTVRLNLKYDHTYKKYLLNFNGMEAVLNPFNTYMIILNWNHSTFSTGLNIYRYTTREDIPVYKRRPEMYWFDYDNPVAEFTGLYNNEYNITAPTECRLHSYPVQVTNIKYYNKCLPREEAIKESMLYTTQHKNCIINDLARPIDAGTGYEVK